METLGRLPQKILLIVITSLLAGAVLAACQPTVPPATPTATPTGQIAALTADPASSGEAVAQANDSGVADSGAEDGSLSTTAEPTAEPTEAPTAAPTEPPAPPEPVGPESYPENVNPLTGLEVDDPSVLQRRPLLIKISNAPEIVRPQSGTSHADIIFEYYVEGGWTRFAALFYGDGADHIGPVRSGRLPDLQLAPAFDAVMVFSGGSQGVIDTVRESDLYPYLTMSPQFGLAEPYFVRFPREELAWEHTLYTDTDELWSLAAERELRSPNFALPGWKFDVVPAEGGTPAAVASLDYAKTSIRWQYDPVSGRYLRWTDGIPHTDAVTGEQLAFENVIVIGSTLELHDLFPEKYFGAEQSLYIELTDYNGPATLLRDGQMFEGRWSRIEGGMLQFTGADGQPMVLKPGHTFVQIVRTGYEQVIVRQ